MASTGLSTAEQTAFRRDSHPKKQLSASERETLLQSHLPPSPSQSAPPPTTAVSSKRRSSSDDPRAPSTPIRSFFHILIYSIISLVFSLYVRFRRAWRLVRGKIIALLRYHHRTPEIIAKDVRPLQKLPKHLSVIVDYHEDDEDQGNAGMEGLVDDVCEITAWVASAGIKNLSIYERTGILKKYLPQTHRRMSNTLEFYFGPTRAPTLTLKAPHHTSYSPPESPTPDPNNPDTPRLHLNVVLLAEDDSRDTIVDLTQTLAEMAQKDQVRLDQITSNLIDVELIENVSTDPDLLILFSPTVQLKGYPPWQLRLTEIFHQPDNKGVNYQVFLRALHNFAKVEMRLGR